MRVSLATFLVICLEFLCYRGEAQSIQCKENEEFQECASGCPLTCQNYRESLFCTEQCKRGCFCRPGYVKGPDDKCIRPTQCPIGPCKDGEIASTCVNPCNNCIQKGKCYFEYCIKGCDCRPGYYRNSTGICVLAEKCGSETHLCPPNEHYNTECVSLCNDCWTQGHCSKLHSSDPYCQPGCDCNPEYFRDDYGTCVHKNECHNHDDGGCGTNEVFTDCVNTCNVCEHQGHCDHHYDCQYGCDCKIGFFRNHDGLCISQSECSAIICGEYEEFRECGPGCITTCENRAHIGECSLPCTRGCFCTSGYIRGLDGKCILPELCPPVCGRNEEYQKCGSACPANCTNQNPRCREVCVRGCFCKPGYIRDPYGICVSPTNCPLLCDENEIFMSCGPRCEASCDAIHRNPALCPGCQRGCFCKPGYVRGPDRKCILPISCPAVCGENEEFKDCGSVCPANCSNPNPTCSNVCVRGCFCKPGFIRNANYTCILPAACPSVCYENEEFSQCGSSCPPTCANRYPACVAQCVKGCFCKSGYVKDENGKCVLPSQCRETCKENETFRLCGTSCPISCNNIGKSVPCKLHCNKGCFCNDGYVRSSNGTCITPDLCPMRCGQHEVVKECGTACQLTCANHTNPGPCDAPCVKGCFCRRGYVRNARGKCILTKNCPARCHNNEVLSCSSRSCEGSCDDDDNSRPCIGECTNGCYCRRDFVRAPDGNCVPRSLCPRVIGFEGRNIGDTGKENDTVTLSTNLAETKSSLTTKTNLDELTKLDEALPILGVLLDEAISTHANSGPASLRTTLSSISEAKRTSQMAMTTKASLKSLESPPTSMTTESPLKSSVNSAMAMTTKSPPKSSVNPTMAITTTSLLKFSENPMMAMEPVVSQSPIQNSIASNPTEMEPSKGNTTELETTTPTNMENTTSNNSMPTVSTMNGTTV